MKQQAEDSRISYIKKPLAAGGFICLGFSSIAFFLFMIAVAIGFYGKGNIPLGGIAVCFSSFLFSVVGIRYGIYSFKEEEKNYILAKIGTAIGGFLAILWLVTILIGLRG
ncbi:MAG: calcium:proton exchanger [Clostridium sp.]